MQFAKGELKQIVIAWIALSVAISLPYFFSLFSSRNGLTLETEYFVAAFIATATGFVAHEMGHKLVAIRNGFGARFQLWPAGVLLALATAVLSTELTGRSYIFGAPGSVYIDPVVVGYYAYGYVASNYKPRAAREESAAISAAGPAINLAFALGFLVLAFFVASTSFVEVVATFGFGINVGLGAFNMLPFPPLDGLKLFKKNVPLALAIAVPLWALFVFFFYL